MSRPAARLAVATGAAVTSVLLLAAPALAHVGVSSSDASQGGYGKVTFRVPDERDVATTTVEVALPADTPLASVSVKAQPGWTYATTTTAPTTPLSSDDGPVTSVVSTVTWTATAGGIAPGSFDEFELAVGPLPKTASMTFKALQTYADGEVVRWIEAAPAGGAEPEHPAPVLQLAAATGEAATAAPAATTGSTTQGSTTQGSTAQGSTTQASTTQGSGRANAALALAGVAALLGLGALARSGRRGTPAVVPAQATAPADRADASR